MAARGRGRGGPSINPPPSPGIQPSASQGSMTAPIPGPKQEADRTLSDIKEVAKYLHSLNHGNLSKYGPIFSEMVINFIKKDPDKRLREVASLLVETITKSKDFAPLGGKVCGGILNQESDKEMRGKLRNEILSQCKMQFKQKNSLRAKSIEQWLAIFAFIGALYQRILINGQHLSALGTAILEGISFTFSLSDTDDDEIECVCALFKEIGPVIEGDEKLKGKCKEVLHMLRTRVISHKSTERMRCLILELLEFRAMGYKDSGKELDDFYPDAMMDAIANDDLHL